MDDLSKLNLKELKSLGVSLGITGKHTKTTLIENIIVIKNEENLSPPNVWTTVKNIDETPFETEVDLLLANNNIKNMNEVVGLIVVGGLMICGFYVFLKQKNNSNKE